MERHAISGNALVYLHQDTQDLIKYGVVVAVYTMKVEHVQNASRLAT